MVIDKFTVSMEVGQGEEKVNRRYIPLKIWFGKAEGMKEPEWLIDVLDVEDRYNRSSFLLRDVKVL
jgi:hypothetical protein